MIADQEQQIEIRLLGTFEVKQGDRLLLAEDWPRRKAAALLKRLALERRMLKDQAIEFLWPEASLTSGTNNLYNTLHTLRQTIDKVLGRGTAEAIFRFEDGVLSLTPSVWVDVQEFERLCATPDRRAADLEQALAFYQGDLLPDDLYEEWTLKFEIYMGLSCRSILTNTARVRLRAVYQEPEVPNSRHPGDRVSPNCEIDHYLIK